MPINGLTAGTGSRYKVKGRKRRLPQSMSTCEGCLQAGTANREDGVDDIGFIELYLLFKVQQKTV